MKIKKSIATLAIVGSLIVGPVANAKPTPHHKGKLLSDTPITTLVDKSYGLLEKALYQAYDRVTRKFLKRTLRHDPGGMVAYEQCAENLNVLTAWQGSQLVSLDSLNSSLHYRIMKDQCAKGAALVGGKLIKTSGEKTSPYDFAYYQFLDSRYFVDYWRANKSFGLRIFDDSDNKVNFVVKFPNDVHASVDESLTSIN